MPQPGFAAPRTDVCRQNHAQDEAPHRHHLLWDNPDAFNPDRFNDPRAIDRFACPPFCEGPRICIGASMAQQEAGSG
jgi:cytochrome P450